MERYSSGTKKLGELVDVDASSCFGLIISFDDNFVDRLERSCACEIAGTNSGALMVLLALVRAVLFGAGW